MDPEIRAYIEAAFLKTMKGKTSLSDEELLDGLLYGADEVHIESLGNSRWWENEFKVVRIGEKLIGFNWATTTGDDSARDKGWEFDPETVCEVEEKERTEVVKFYEAKVTNRPISPVPANPA